ncbi:hypothetical protein X741_29350 [Mesorhizobium sp. LNHC229A00]|nr:hypothetical protein X741_29350 [Mesorhizobium sp. LNHC229A00]
MGFSKRLLILLHLMDGERSVSEMVSLIGASRTALSQHLSGMAKLGIVKSRTQGKRRFYSCTSEQAKMVVSFLSDLAISRASLINTVQTPDRGWRQRTARPPIA